MDWTVSKGMSRPEGSAARSRGWSPCGRSPRKRETPTPLSPPPPVLANVELCDSYEFLLIRLMMRRQMAGEGNGEGAAFRGLRPDASHRSCAPGYALPARWASAWRKAGQFFKAVPLAVMAKNCRRRPIAPATYSSSSSRVRASRGPIPQARAQATNSVTSTRRLATSQS